MKYKQAIEHKSRWIVQHHPQCELGLGEYTTDEETQIMLDKRGMIPLDVYLGEPGQHTGWILPHDGHCYRVNDIRIPFGSNTDSPSWPKGHSEVMGPVVDRFCLFGTSGWNWADKKSLWVGYDFDSLTNHSDGLTDDSTGRNPHKSGVTFLRDCPHKQERQGHSSTGVFWSRCSTHHTKPQRTRTTCKRRARPYVS